MIYRYILPTAALQPYVKGFHLIHFQLSGVAVQPVRTYFPHVEQCLTFDPLGRVTSTHKASGHTVQRSAAYLSRQQTTAYDLVLPQEYLMLKIIFQPGVLYRLLGVPLSALGNDYLDATTVLGAEVNRVNEQLLEARSYAGMIQVAEGYVMEKVTGIKKESLPIDQLYTMMSSNEARFSVDWLAKQACLSTRQLERKFAERIGISPVMYHRLIRFNHAFEMKEKQPHLSWFAIAIYCGYTDLQHLIKDFRQFACNTPTALLHEETNAIQRQLQLV